LARLFGALLAGSSAHGAVLPEDHAEALLHDYNGGGVQARGPAFLVRKSMADKVSVSGSYYVDAVSNASIDVVTTASPFKETRTAVGLGADYLVRESLISLSLESSREPDYVAKSVGLDIAQDMFAGMTTVSLGFTRGSDDVGKKTIGFFDQATHWQYRAGLTQVLSPRWLASLNFEAVADSGYLGSPYRAARVFSAFVPERNPRTRSSRALQLRTVGALGEGASRMAVHASFRHFWDNWNIRAETLEFGASRYFGERWLADASLRLYSQGKALFYSDNASSETLYISRNRQLGTFRSTAFTARLSYRFGGAAARYGTQLTGAYELRRFQYSDFTDLRTGLPYSFNANVLQAYVSANF
jgi:hypothetical protein